MKSITFGKRLTEVRKTGKISQDALAKMAGVHGAMTGCYEQDKIKPSIETGQNIANALGVTLDYLLGGSNNSVLDKELLKRFEGVESPSLEDKNKI